MNRIRQSTNPSQWHFVNSVNIPADLASKPSTAAELNTSRWYEGPEILQRMHDDSNEITFNLVDPDSDAEVRSEPLVCKTNLQTPGLGSSRFSRFSNWKKLCGVIARLINVVRGFQHGSKVGWKIFSFEPDPDAIRAASHVIITIVQQEYYVQEIKCLQINLHVRKESKIHSLSPFIGKHESYAGVSLNFSLWNLFNIIRSINRFNTKNEFLFEPSLSTSKKYTLS